MENIPGKIEEAFAFIAPRIKERPGIALILGTGLGGLAEGMEIQQTLPYGEIPHFPRTTVKEHAGQFIFGRYGGQNILTMQGRVHPYEGYPPAQATFPVRVMKKLGVKILIISNAAGGLNPLFRPGDVMILSDHINLMGQNPLVGLNLDDLGPRFPDMSAAYDKALADLAEETARREGVQLHRGVYAGVSGPSLETPAETRFLRMTGADAVGMSTVPEVIVAVQAGLRVLAFSAITNINLPDRMQPASMEEILTHAATAGKKLARILPGLLNKL